MDPLTHTLLGVGMANAFFRRRVGPRAVLILALASNLPDIDALVHVSGDPTAVLMRRTFGHSLLMIPAWCALLALALGRVYPATGRRTLFGLALLGAGVHVFFDLVNSFGVVLLWPFGGWRPELSMVYIVDLVLAGCLLLPLLVAVPRSLRPFLGPASRACLACAAVYVLVCGAARLRAKSILEVEAGSLRPRPDFTYVFPEPLGPHRWRGVARQGTTYRVYLVRPLAGTAEPRRVIETDLRYPAVERARASPLGRRLEWFFKAPVWSVLARPGSSSPGRAGPGSAGPGSAGPGSAGPGSAAPGSASEGGGGLGGPGAAEPGAFVVGVYDLRFTSLVLPRRAVFEYGFQVRPDGSVRFLR